MIFYVSSGTLILNHAHSPSPLSNETINKFHFRSPKYIKKSSAIAETTHVMAKIAVDWLTLTVTLNMTYLDFI